MLLEDFPGLGKTLAARSFAQTLGLDFTRAQFTPDLLPADLTGSFVYDQRRGEFDFRRGPLFTGLLLADEINRTPPKTQAALLEAMQERPGHRRGPDVPAARARSTCSPPPTRSSTRAPTRCPRRSSTASCCASASATPPPTRSRTCCAAGSTGSARRSTSTAVTDAAGLLAMQAAVER